MGTPGSKFSSESEKRRSSSEYEEETNRGGGVSYGFWGRLNRFFSHIAFSSILRRIVIFNLAALTVLVASIMYLNHFRSGLVAAKIASLRTQGQIIAGAIAASAVYNGNIDKIKLDDLSYQLGGLAVNRLRKRNFFPIDQQQVSVLLRHVISPDSTRALIYDTDNNLLVDSNFLYYHGQVLEYHEDGRGDLLNKVNPFGRIYRSILSRDCLPIDRNQKDLRSYRAELIQSLKNGNPLAVKRYCDAEDHLSVMVALPIPYGNKAIGFLILVTVGDDIEKIVFAERLSIFKIALVVAFVLLILSIFLGYTIANPLRKLSEAANRVCKGLNKRVPIPDYSNRQDEIGDLSSSIRAMTNAFYSRMDLIESFAADVSHELKNPLTSLRSALEAFPLAKTDISKKQLYEIMNHDILRLDRLITDISHASRIDAELSREVISAVNVESLLQSFASTYSVHSKNSEKDLTVSFVVDPLGNYASYNVAGHELRLGQVFSNILSNARSFVPKENGHIKMHLYRNAQKIYVDIIDNGPGIRAENIESIFERFYTDRPEGESFGQNSGLGLSISRQIIKNYGGTLLARNVKNPEAPHEILGACFTVILPAFDVK